ncbi:MAG: serpin family protein [Akkermansiaceae bacterium]|nr:serpin family protein [Verrucomicrobiales bacterium]
MNISDYPLKRHKTIYLPLLAILGWSIISARAAEPAFSAAHMINALGIDLLHQTKPASGNFLLSPYSIQSALAMTYAGADGVTREEMAKALHFPKDEAVLHRAFLALQQRLSAIATNSSNQTAKLKRSGWKVGDPIQFEIANRLFGQKGYAFRAPFLTLVKNNYQAPFEPLDFASTPAAATAATKHINEWVEQETHRRIQGVLPEGALTKYTRLVLVNAIYLKAPWESEFRDSATQPRPFYLSNNVATNVPTMHQLHEFGYAKAVGFSAVSLNYAGAEIGFLILLPDKRDGLAALESQLTPAMLVQCANLPVREVNLFLPKFRLEPPMMPLGNQLKKLGMKSAFDEPPGSAKFDRMAPRTPDDYLYISDVYHKTFLKIDEQGTEAAAATAVGIDESIGLHSPPPKPIEVKVDHPFLFAILHRSTGVCLFLGRVTDPR